MLTFNATFGVYPGYVNVASTSEAALDLVSKIWQEAAQKEANRSSIFISAVLVEGRVIYSNEKGCPETGEFIVQAMGVQNPKFYKYESDWKDSVKQVVRDVKLALNQTRVTLFFQSVEELDYIEDEPAPKTAPNADVRIPTHPGEVLSDILDGVDESTNRIANILGISSQHLYMMLKGRRGLSPKMAVKIAKAFGGSTDMWLRMQATYDAWNIERKIDVSAIPRLSAQIKNR